jgi:hypothetical protein
MVELLNQGHDFGRVLSPDFRSFALAHGGQLTAQGSQRSQCQLQLHDHGGDQPRCQHAQRGHQHLGKARSGVASMAASAAIIRRSGGAPASGSCTVRVTITRVLPLPSDIWP